MSQESCLACGEPTIFEEELGSAICTHCGTLANPSQSILDSHLEHADTSGRDYYPQSIPLSSSTTLKGINGRSLAGQDKDARDRRNTISMHGFIRTLCSNLSQPGCSIRAQGIFDQAMARGRFRWGKKSKLIAGASVAIASREAHKSISLRDVAYLLEEPVTSLARSFTNMCTILQLNIHLFEPAQHIPTIENHFLALLRTPKESSLPNQLVTLLTPLIPRLAAIRNTVTSLATLAARVEALANLPTAPIACALFILALEGELSASLPNAGALAQALGARTGVGKAVVMLRYKTVYDVVAECIKEVPWLDAHEHKPQGKSRSKVAKRVVVAKGLKDVIQFQDEIWRRKFADTDKPVMLLDDIEDDDGSTIDGSLCSVGESQASTSSENPWPRRHSTKQRKTRHERHVAEVSRFMLDPLADKQANLNRGQGLFEHLLTADDSALSHTFVHPPSRLQLLATSRGEDAIDDAELFEEGELEGLLRSQEEVDAVRAAFNWDETSEGESTHPPSKRKRRQTDDDEADTSAHKTRRIDMDVLARLLDPSTVVGESDFESQIRDDEDDDREERFARCSGDAEETVEEWRPLSPGGRNFDDDRYDI